MVIPPKKRQQFKCAVCSAETGSVRFRCAEILPKVVNPIIPTNGDPIDDPLVDKATCPDFDLCVPVEYTSPSMPLAMLTRYLTTC
jgi:hypothetical protein